MRRTPAHGRIAPALLSSVMPAHRRHRLLPLDPERLPPGSQDDDPGALLHDIGDDAGGVAQHVLAVAHNGQQGPRPEVFDNRLLDRQARTLLDAQGGDDGMHDRAAVGRAATSIARRVSRLRPRRSGSPTDRRAGRSGRGRAPCSARRPCSPAAGGAPAAAVRSRRGRGRGLARNAVLRWPASSRCCRRPSCQ